MFQNRLGSLIAGRKFTILLCFTLYLRAISKYKPPGVLYLEGRFNEGFFCVTSLGGLIFGGAYTWRGLFSELYCIFGACDELACVHHSQALRRDNHLVTRAFKSDYGCAKIAV